MAARTPTDNNIDRVDDPGHPPLTLGNRSKRLLLGLPCSQCMAYYEAERTACPICGCTERLGAIMEMRSGPPGKVVGTDDLPARA